MANEAEQHEAAARKKLADDKSVREKASQERAKMAEGVKPTPTQEECDLAAMGVYLAEHEADGSPPDQDDPTLTPQTRSSEARPKSTYSTRASTASSSS